MNGESGIDWTSNVRTAASRHSDGIAVIQLSIPLEDLGFVPVRDDNIVETVWRFNVRRNHAKGPARAIERQSTLAPITETHDLQHYLRIRRQPVASPVAYSANLNSEAGYVAKERQSRFWRPAQPMFEELLSDVKPPLSGQGSIFWYHPFDPAMIPFALQYGIPWNREEFGDLFVRNRLHI